MCGIAERKPASFGGRNRDFERGLQAARQEREREYHEFHEEKKRFEEENEKLRKENEELRKQIEELRHEIAQIRNDKEKIEQKNETLERKVETLTAEVGDLKNEKEKERLSMLAYDLSSLFLYYCVFPEHRDWMAFTNDVSEKRADVDDGLLEQDKFDSWLKQYPYSHLLLPIQEITTARHQVAHKDLRSAKSQQTFLDSLKSERWEILPGPFGFTIKEMLSELQNVKLKRKK